MMGSYRYARSGELPPMVRTNSPTATEHPIESSEPRKVSKRRSASKLNGSRPTRLMLFLLSKPLDSATVSI
jgi:hypothetical protein